MTLWAYPGEPLRDHLLEVARVGRELFPREVELFERRAGLPWEYVAYFHDVGKGHVVYQSGAVDSFKCHEVYSAAVAYMALRELGEFGARAVATAALLHHHAMERADECAYMFRHLVLSPRFEPAEGFDELLEELVGVRAPVVSNAWDTAVYAASDPKAYAVAQIALGPLIIADNIVASRRGGRPHRLLLELARELPAVAKYLNTGAKNGAHPPPSV